MKINYISSLAFLFFLLINLSNIIAQNNKTSMPFDMIFIGYDNNLGGTNSEKIGVLTMVDIYEGYTFGIVNMVPNSDKWESHNEDGLVQVSFKIKSGNIFKKGSLLEIKNLNGQIFIFSNDKDVSDQFEISGLKNSTDKFLKSSGAYISLYSGYFTSSQKEILMGTLLDALSIGISQHTLTGIDLGGSLDDKDLFTTDDPTDGGGSIDIGDCRLCDILLIILDPDNWNFTPGTPQDDVDLSDFNIEDCAEIDCEDGTLAIDTIDGSIVITEFPCDRETMTYKWLISVNGVFVTVAQGNGPIVPPYDFDQQNCVDNTYRLIVVCENGCEYFDDFFIECEEECGLTIEVFTDSCTLSVLVEGCVNPTIQWFYVESNNSITPIGNGSSINASQDGNYFVEISGCEGCETEISDYFFIKGCEECICSQEGEVDDCIIIFETDGCEGFTDLWEYSVNGENGWTTIDFHGDIYNPTNDGFYRRSLIKDECQIIDTLEVDCILECPDFMASSNITQNCNIEIDYQGCMEIIDIQISYAISNSNNSCDSTLMYIPGGGNIIDNTDNGQSGTILIEPEYENSCYKITLTCSNGCVLELFIWNGQCCQGNLTIEEINCEITASGIPCIDTFAYTWIINGVPQQTFMGDSVPPLTPASNDTFQLEVICADSCVYVSNIEIVTCIDPLCDSQASIIPDECFMTATVTNCPDAQFQWQIDTGNGFEDIPGETNQVYIATSDDPIKVVVSNCDNCDDGEVAFVYTPMGCDDMCDCETEVWVDENCILQSSDSDCEEILWMSWWKSDDGGATWTNFIESAWQSSFTPPSNGLYKKLIEFSPGSGCPDVEDEVDVDCLEECDDAVIITPEITEDCYLKASWVGCFDFEEDDIGWYFTGSSNCPSNSSTIFPTTLPAVDTIIEFENNPMDGTGYLIVKPSDGPGCYFFNFQCNGCEVQQVWIEWEECCDECIPEFEYTENCLIEFASSTDEECLDVLLADGFSATYYFASGGFTYVEINEQEFYTPTNIGWYKIIFTHPDCADIETLAIFVDELCPLEGEVFYDCETGFYYEISGGVAPYSFYWGADFDYPSFEGGPIIGGDHLPYNESMPIIAYDSNGDFLVFDLVIDCPCQSDTTLFDSKAVFKVISWTVTQDGNQYQYDGDWSDNTVCLSPDGSDELEVEITNWAQANCISNYSPIVNISISGGSVSIDATFDIYCQIHQLQLIVEDCTGSGGIDTLTLDYECMLQFPKPELTSLEENSLKAVSNIQIFPNPTRNFFTLKTTPIENEYLRIKLFDTQGRMVQEKQLRTNSNNEYSLDSSILQSGIYFLWVESKNNTIGYEKLIIIK